MTERAQNIMAYAKIKGSEAYPDITGIVTFRQMKNGVLVTSQIAGLPYDEEQRFRVYGFHIHEGTNCSGNDQDPFADAGGHYNPQKALHPYHAGDLPPLFGNNGYAFMSVLTARFKVEDIIGRTVIIHGGIDDFSSQPAGNAGSKIACGKILLNQNNF